MVEHIEWKDMDRKEVIDLVGQEMWKKMSKIMAGQSGEIIDGKFLMFGYDLERAYRICKDGM